MSENKLFQWISLLLISLFLFACASNKPHNTAINWTSNIAEFEKEIQALQKDLAIPGLAYVIVQDGQRVAENAFGVTQEDPQAPFTLNTPLRIASVTKSLTAVVALQLVEEGRLDIDKSARYYVPGLNIPNNVLVRHLLAHTSEGVVGEEFVYSTNRYAMLSQIITAISGKSFEQEINDRVLSRAGMQSYPSPALGAHAGFVSTTRDMGKYLTALDTGVLLKPASIKKLTIPSLSKSGTALPISLGWFTQSVQGEVVVWSFGQDDPDHSGALLLQVPRKGLSIFILANSNVMSDAFRLLMADISKSPFSLSFLRLFVFSHAGAPLATPGYTIKLEQQLAELEANGSYRYRDELLSRALIDQWLGRTDETQIKIDLADKRYSATNKPDAVMHFAALRLNEQHSKQSAIAMGEQLLNAQPNNRWILLAQAYLLQQEKRFEESMQCFRGILGLQNQEADFLSLLFKGWSWMALAQMTLESNPEQAKIYLQALIGSGIKGQTLDEAKKMIDRIDTVQ